MQYGRITTLVGAVLALIGLGLQSASSDAEPILPDLNAVNPDIPVGFDRVITSMWDDSAAGTAIFLIALVAVIVVSLIPDIKDALSRMNALIVTVLGVLMMVVGGIATSRAIDKADTLELGLAGAFEAGLIPQAFTVSTSVGWYLLAIGGVIAAIGGVLGLIARPDESALSD